MIAYIVKLVHAGFLNSKFLINVICFATVLSTVSTSSSNCAKIIVYKRDFRRGFYHSYNICNFVFSNQ